MRRYYFAWRVRAWRLFGGPGDCAVFSGDEGGGEVCEERRDCSGDLQWIQILLEAGLLPGAMMRNKGLAVYLPACLCTGRADRYALSLAWRSRDKC